MRRILFIIIFMLTLVDINYGQTPVKRQTQKGTASSAKISKLTPKPYGSSTKSTAAKDGQRFVQDGVTYGVMSVTDKTLKLVKANKSVTHYQIPSQLKVNGVNYTVTSIEGHAFEGCSSLTSLNKPPSLQAQEGNA
ncbi:MAG: leucine-rich repeat domain-containing protein, partial [Muribaculaceae bacterium]|nr:leucine-rich repeat domain-containing protein [Muribaculaceae bacterium]